MIAAGNGEAEEVKKLLAGGDSPFLLDSLTGTSPLHFAAQGGNIEVARLLIGAGALINLQAASNSFTPLMVAVWYRNPEMVQFLLEQKRINPLMKNLFGMTAREFINEKDEASQNRADREIIGIFDEFFKNRNIFITHHFEEDEVTPKPSGNINVRIPNGINGNDYHTSALVAGRNGDIALLKKLLADGADILATDEYMLANIAHKAAYNGHADILELICRLPDFDEIKDKQGPTNGYTPLHDAVWHGHYEAVKILLSSGVIRDLKAWDNLTPLDLALKNGYEEIAELFK
ncbi:ankyrin repeat domain-containing protein [Ottowia thiooxydans]|uniref:ankyrin repeat domain-containing protein n=1 Tax=Ottowia thiooxydans TaxID=219182 RepID=UPI000490F484|nr:ankyrin repeat domain-containing protein [Ottowia thiooxydans]